MADRALAVALLRSKATPSVTLVAERKAGLVAARRAKRIAMGRQRYFDRPASRAARMRAAAAREAAFHAKSMVFSGETRRKIPAWRRCRDVAQEASRRDAGAKRERGRRAR
jgi:hypothetical protein